MRHRHPFAFSRIAAVLLALHLAAPWCQIPTLALCIESSGEWAIKFLPNGRCCAASATLPSEAAKAPRVHADDCCVALEQSVEPAADKNLAAAAAEDCGPCFDIPLGDDAVFTASGSRPELQTPPQSHLAELPPFSSDLAPSRHADPAFLRPDPVPDRWRVHLRNVVLLI